MTPEHTIIWAVAAVAMTSTCVGLALAAWLVIRLERKRNGRAGR